MKKANNGMAVCCPKCGTLKGVSPIGIEYHYCLNKECGIRYTAWIVDGIVMCFESRNDEKSNSFDRLDICKDKLLKLQALK